MQYDENAEKYGYEGEMTPLKCDELKMHHISEVWDMHNLTRGKMGFSIVYYADEVDAAIAELKDVIHKLQVDLEGAKATAYADSVDAGMRERKLRRALYNLRACYADMMQKRYIECKTDGWVHRVNKWIEVERKCRAKAEEYK